MMHYPDPLSGTAHDTGHETTIHYSSWSTFGQILCFVNFCIGFVAVALNMFVIYTLAFKRGLFHIRGADVFVIGLTVTDLFTGLALMASIKFILGGFTGDTCIMLLCAIQSTMLCSALFLSLMTGDRYFKIVHPFHYQTACSTDWAPWSIALSTYTISLIIGFLPAMGVGASENIDKYNCNYLQVMTMAYRVPFKILMFLPVITAILLYTKIFTVAKRHIENIAKTMGGTSKVPKGRYIKLIFIIAGLYLLFYIPPVVVSFIYYDLSNVTSEESNEIRTIFHTSALLLICNCIANPLVYAYTIPVVKNTFRQVIGLPEQEETYIGSSVLAESFMSQASNDQAYNVQETSIEQQEQEEENALRIHQLFHEQYHRHRHHGQSDENRYSDSDDTTRGSKHKKKKKKKRHRHKGGNKVAPGEETLEFERGEGRYEGCESDVLESFQGESDVASIKSADSRRRRVKEKKLRRKKKKARSIGPSVSTVSESTMHGETTLHEVKSDSSIQHFEHGQFE